MASRLKKELQPLLTELRQHGFIEIRHKRHPRWEHPVTHVKFTVPTSPSDRRSLLNSLTAFRRLCRTHNIGRGTP